MQRLGPFSGQPAPHALARILRNDRHVRQAAGQRAEIEARATDEDGQFSPLAQFRDDGRRDDA